MRTVRRRVRCRCPRTVRIATEDLDGWLRPVWDRATAFFGVQGWARYEWYNGACYGRCHLWDPSKVSLSRPHFRRFMLEDDRREAAAVVVHELLHGLGLQHDKRIGWSLTVGFRTDYELVDRVFDGKPLSDNVRKLLRRVTRAATKRYRLFCPGTTREHRVGADGFTCRSCGVPVGGDLRAAAAAHRRGAPGPPATGEAISAPRPLGRRG